MILDLIDKQTNPTLATYAKQGEVHLRVTARAATEEEAKKLLKPMVKEIKKRFGEAVYTTDEKETADRNVVVKLLKKHELTVTTAESCTGGLLAGTLVAFRACRRYSERALSPIPIRRNGSCWM